MPCSKCHARLKQVLLHDRSRTSSETNSQKTEKTTYSTPQNRLPLLHWRISCTYFETSSVRIERGDTARGTEVIEQLKRRALERSKGGQQGEAFKNNTNRRRASVDSLAILGITVVRPHLPSRIKLDSSAETFAQWQETAMGLPRDRTVTVPKRSGKGVATETTPRWS